MVGRDAWIAVYIMASQRNGTLYTGVTSALVDRVLQHKLGTFDGFSKACGCKRLVWCEDQASMADAIVREKRIKRWRREWKLALIEADNLEWRDLSDGWFELPEGPLRLDAAARAVRRGAAGSRVSGVLRAPTPGMTVGRESNPHPVIPAGARGAESRDPAARRFRAALRHLPYRFAFG